MEDNGVLVYRWPMRNSIVADSGRLATPRPPPPRCGPWLTGGLSNISTLAAPTRSGRTCAAPNEATSPTLSIISYPIPRGRRPWERPIGDDLLAHNTLDPFGRFRRLADTSIEHRAQSVELLRQKVDREVAALGEPDWPFGGGLGCFSEVRKAACGDSLLGNDVAGVAAAVIVTLRLLGGGDRPHPEKSVAPHGMGESTGTRLDHVLRRASSATTTQAFEESRDPDSRRDDGEWISLRSPSWRGRHIARTDIVRSRRSLRSGVPLGARTRLRTTFNIGGFGLPPSRTHKHFESRSKLTGRVGSTDLNDPAHPFVRIDGEQRELSRREHLTDTVVPQSLGWLH